MARVNEVLIKNLHNLNSHMELVATVLDGTGVEHSGGTCVV